MPDADLLQTPLPWIGPNDPLPDPRGAWRDPNGLLAASADLSPSRLVEAYSRGIFPWYSDGQPVLWWSPDPRMVLVAAARRWPVLDLSGKAKRALDNLAAEADMHRKYADYYPYVFFVARLKS